MRRFILAKLISAPPFLQGNRFQLRDTLKNELTELYFVLCVGQRVQFTDQDHEPWAVLKHIIVAAKFKNDGFLLALPVFFILVHWEQLEDLVR